MVTLVTRGKGHGLGVASFTEVAAPCDQVWETITDVESWPSYHENIVSVERVNAEHNFAAGPVTHKRPGCDTSASSVGTKYRVSKVIHGHVHVCHFTVTFVDNEGPTKSMKFFHDEGGMLSMVTLTVEPSDDFNCCGEFTSSCEEELSAKRCRLMETAAVELSCPFGKALMAVSCYPPFNGMMKKIIKRKFERGLREFATAAERNVQ
mmetsp:Transcript_25573/g.75409  ORF Transcript_25573/g.75409 Transcript_25573/m.75409 type:complete len:207 (-) Transcript_25573:1747-2367(-)